MNSKVSIIIIARNEEENIAECLTSALVSASEIGGAELLLADSASNDRTAEIALEKGAKVLRLKPDWELSASAGRHIGTHYATGEYILFIDADTLVYKDFLSKAVAALDENPKLAGVCGFLDDANEGSEDVLVFEDRSEKLKEIKWMRGGCCFYRRTAILEVGSFNPYLLTEEEADIGLRLERGGWKLQMLPIPMAVHTRCTEDLSGKSILKHISRSIFSGRFGGTTRTLGYAFKNGYGFKFCRLRMPTAVFFAIWIFMVVGLASLSLPVFQIAALVLIFLGFVLTRIAKGNVKKTFLFFIAKSIYCINLLAGILKLKFTPTSEYPLDVDILENKKIKAAISEENDEEPALYGLNGRNQTAVHKNC